MKTDQCITSRHNPKYKLWHSLLTSKGLRDAEQFLLSGRKLVPEILRDRPELGLAILWTEAPLPPPLPTRQDLPVFSLSKELFMDLDVFGTHFPLLVGHAPTRPEMAEAPELISGPRVFLPLGDPTNLGVALRSVAAFGAEQTVLLKESAHPLHPKTLRASSGTALRLSLFTGPGLHDIEGEMVDLNGPRQTNLVTLDRDGQDIRDFEWPRHPQILVGQEGQGLPPALKKRAIRIPLAREVESLNAATALSLALFSYRLQWPLLTRPKV